MRARQQRGDLREAAIKDAKTRLCRFCKGNEGLQVQELTGEDLDSWLDTQGFKPQNRQNYKRIISIFLNWLVHEGRIDRNPAKETRKARMPSRMPTIWTAQETEIMFRAAGRMERTERDCFNAYLAVCFFGAFVTEILYMDDVSKGCVSRQITVPSIGVTDPTFVHVPLARSCGRSTAMFGITGSTWACCHVRTTWLPSYSTESILRNELLSRGRSECFYMAPTLSMSIVGIIPVVVGCSLGQSGEIGTVGSGQGRLVGFEMNVVVPKGLVLQGIIVAPEGRDGRRRPRCRLRSCRPRCIS